MGNSEVGHNALGAGRIFTQGCVAYLDGCGLIPILPLCYNWVASNPILYFDFYLFFSYLFCLERPFAGPLSRKVRTQTIKQLLSGYGFRASFTVLE